MSGDDLLEPAIRQRSIPDQDAGPPAPRQLVIGRRAIDGKLIRSITGSL
jgi:hypothetical protein